MMIFISFGVVLLLFFFLTDIMSQNFSSFFTARAFPRVRQIPRTIISLQNLGIFPRLSIDGSQDPDESVA